MRGRELVLYWRQMKPGEKIIVPIDLICRVPGEYRGPASRAYLYYNADTKHWIDPIAVKVAPQQEVSVCEKINCTAIFGDVSSYFATAVLSDSRSFHKLSEFVKKSTVPRFSVT